MWHSFLYFDGSWALASVRQRFCWAVAVEFQGLCWALVSVLQWFCLALVSDVAEAVPDCLGKIRDLVSLVLRRLQRHGCSQPAEVDQVIPRSFPH